MQQESYSLYDFDLRASAGNDNMIVVDVMRTVEFCEIQDASAEATSFPSLVSYPAIRSLIIDSPYVDVIGSQLFMDIGILKSWINEIKHKASQGKESGIDAFTISNIREFLF